jgi:AAA+ ATPase superfamily predicted ATPase
VVIHKPVEVFDRGHEWDDLATFATDESPGLKVGIVRGRRRHGKSFLLEHLCQAVDGVYTVALRRQSRVMALDRFAGSLAEALGHPVGRFDDWDGALVTAIGALGARAARVPLLVIDEIPYLVEHSPELPSVIQVLYDQRGPRRGRPPFKLVLCGSSISVMSTLLAGDQALYGRATLDLRMGPFTFRDAAAYWDVPPDVALHIDAAVGGAPGYHDIIGKPPGSGRAGFFRWLERSLLNPSHILFAEPDYLLQGDPRISDRAIYHAIWSAVSAGASTPTQIGAVLGMDAKALTYHLNVMRDGGFVSYDRDILLQRRPVITVADPAVRFHNLIVAPNVSDLEMRRARAVWDRCRATFAAKILGPHFEHLAREWTRWYADEAGIDAGSVGTTHVACPEHRGHEVDVVALDRGSIPRTRSARIVVLGEAKATNASPGLPALDRLAHIRDILVAHGWDAGDAKLALFSRTPFGREVLDTAGADHLLVDLSRLYGTG